jgi:protein translocase SecG subunit
MILAAAYHGILAFFFAIVGIVLMGVILLQRGKGVGLAGAFGGTGGHTAFGAKTGDFLMWVTVVGAGILLAFAIILNFVFVPVAPSMGAAAPAPTPGPVAPAPSGPVMPSGPMTPMPNPMPTPPPGESPAKPLPMTPTPPPGESPARPLPPPPTTPAPAPTPAENPAPTGGGTPPAEGSPTPGPVSQAWNTWNAAAPLAIFGETA